MAKNSPPMISVAPRGGKAVCASRTVITAKGIVNNAVPKVPIQKVSPKDSRAARRSRNQPGVK